MGGIRSTLVATLLATLSLAGCTGAAPDVAIDDVQATNGVDLRSQGMNVTMPGPNASALLLLDVPADLWVHWKVGLCCTPGVQSYVEDEAWTVCILLQPFATGPSNRLKVSVYELQGAELVNARGGGPVAIEIFDADAPTCLMSVLTSTGETSAGITSMEPRDIRIVLAVTSVWGGAVEMPAFWMHVGIGTVPCQGLSVQSAIHLCGPLELVSVEPLLRGEATSAAFATDDFWCGGYRADSRGRATQACRGFEVDDRRQRLDNVSLGTLVASRSTSPAMPNLLYLDVSASAGYKDVQTPVASRHERIAAGQSSLSTVVRVDSVELSSSCTAPPNGQSSERFVAWSDDAIDIMAEWDTSGVTSFRIHSTESHLDLAHVGWTLAPIVFASPETACGS